MNLNKIISVLCKLYEENCTMKGLTPTLPAPYVIDLLAVPTDKQRKQLETGSGNPIAEMHQINSSSGMSFNFYKLFEEANEISVDFEWKESIPVTKSNAPANIDVRYETKERVIVFVECKYLEPYYSPCERNSAAYFDIERYPFVHHRNEWVDLMRKEEEFAYYNIAQIFRHLLAIYRHTLEHPDIYDGKKIMLKSVMWKMPDAFLERYNQEEKGKNIKKNQTRLKKLYDEKVMAEKIINEFTRKIGWTNFTFKSEYYNDIIDEIKESKRYNDFLTQYSLN